MNSKIENLYNTNSIRTKSGIYVNVFEPTEDMFTIEDIAHALSNIPRFGGHLPVFYSVAQHSVHVSRDEDLSYSNYSQFDGLMHDSAEAYLLDFPTPIKSRFPEYKKIETYLLKVISNKFKFNPNNNLVKLADRRALEWEWNNLMINPDFDLCSEQCLSPNEAKELFLNRYYELTKNV